MPYITPQPMPDYEEAKQAIKDHNMELAREVMEETTVDNGEDQEDQREFFETDYTQHELSSIEASMGF